MIITYKILIIISVFLLSTYLFYKASGTLAINNLNLISGTYYIFMLQTFIGISLVYLGFDKHYLVQKAINRVSLEKTFFLVVCAAILIPFSMCILSWLHEKKGFLYKNKLSRDINFTEDTDTMFYCVFLLSIIFIFFAVKMFILIGHVPLLEIIFQRNVHLFATRRIEISRHYVGNIYIRNIIVLTLIPALSYLTFTYAYIMKQWKWKILFVVLFISSIFIKTYDYAKAPVVFYLMPFLFIYMILNRGVKKRTLFILGLSGLLLIVLMYAVTGGALGIKLDIYNGPVARTIFSPVGALILHIDLFPNYLPYLHGRSFAPTLLKLLSSDVNHIRSARAVMKFYNPQGVYEGVSGVMNSFFIGEAYANFGLVGIIFASIYIGILLELIYLIFTGRNKNPITITAYSTISTHLILTLHGGFVDFLYNIPIFSIVLLFLGLNVFQYRRTLWYKMKERGKCKGEKK